MNPIRSAGGFYQLLEGATALSVETSKIQTTHIESLKLTSFLLKNSLNCMTSSPVYSKSDI
jgi:hypothetical protein